MKQFLVNGKEFDPDPPKPKSIAVKRILDKLDGEVIDTEELLRRVDVGHEALSIFKKRFPDYVYKRGMNYYGPPESIKKFKSIVERAKRK